MLQTIKKPEAKSMVSSYEDKAMKWNNRPGELAGYDCDTCKNKGLILHINNGIEFYEECKCMQLRYSLQRIKNSGLRDLFTNCTFGNFEINSRWQENMLACAQEFLKDNSGEWFFVGGQVGSGKTHICTAIVGSFLQAGKAARYMLWRDDVVRLKAMVMDNEGYQKAIEEFKRTPVLYIDDFFKGEKGAKPTAADINIAFEILNYRYINSDLITIISSEKDMDDLIELDEAVGSRIYQKSKKYCMRIAAAPDKNYRLHSSL